MKNLLKSNICGSREQCTSILCILKSQQNRLKQKKEKKKKKKEEEKKTQNAGNAIQTAPKENV